MLFLAVAWSGMNGLMTYAIWKRVKTKAAARMVQLEKRVFELEVKEIV